VGRKGASDTFSGAVTVRPLREADLAAADRINRLAFGTFFGLADPMTFRGDGEAVRGRFYADPDGAVAAEIGERLVGSGFLMNWGSVGVLGPLTVDVAAWSRGIARAVMPELVARLDARKHTLAGLFTHPQSAKHIRLYESFGFWMQRPTAVMEKPVAADGLPEGALRFSDLDPSGKRTAIKDMRAVAETVYPGLDLAREIRVADDLRRGDTVMITHGGAVCGFAVCQHGPHTEGGSGQLLVKFGSVRSGPGAEERFVRLLRASEGLAAERGAPKVHAGTNVGRAGAYQLMLRAGFRTWMNGIIMNRPDTPGYNRGDVFAIDDWR
jgi:predicted N-acetyltransferase YhbS